MELNNTSHQKAMTSRTPGPMLGNCNIHTTVDEFEHWGQGGAHEGGPRKVNAQPFSCPMCHRRWANSTATKEHMASLDVEWRQPIQPTIGGDGPHQSCTCGTNWKFEMMRIYRNPPMINCKGCNPQEEKERARHVTWNAWWQHFHASFFPCKSHNSPERTVEPKLTWELH